MYPSPLGYVPKKIDWNTYKFESPTLSQYIRILFYLLTNVAHTMKNVKKKKLKQIRKLKDMNMFY